MRVVSASTDTPSDFSFLSLRLDGQVALVIGGSRGIGFGIGQALAAAGADVGLAARTTRDLETAAGTLGRDGTDARAFTVDVADVESIRTLVARVHEAYGRLDILVNSAGLNLRAPAERVSEDDWNRVQAVNLRGMFFACQAAASIMRPAGRGKIINIASTSDVVSIPGVTSYAISKAGVRQLTRSLAAEWAHDHINVNAIAPGRLRTAMTEELFADPKRRRKVIDTIPWGRAGHIGELGGAAVLLASDAGSYITGQVIHVCGGQSLAPSDAG